MTEEQARWPREVEGLGQVSAAGRRAEALRPACVRSCDRGRKVDALHDRDGEAGTRADARTTFGL